MLAAPSSSSGRPRPATRRRGQLTRTPRASRGEAEPRERLQNPPDKLGPVQPRPGPDVTHPSAARGIRAHSALAPHPEGGHYRETFRSEARVQAAHGDRAAVTSILFLLESGEESRPHRVLGDEIWLHHGGDDIDLDIDGRTIRLGSSDDASLQAFVPGGAWQAARHRRAGWVRARRLRGRSRLRVQRLRARGRLSLRSARRAPPPPCARPTPCRDPGRPWGRRRSDPGRVSRVRAGTCGRG